MLQVHNTHCLMCTQAHQRYSVEFMVPGFITKEYCIFGPGY